MLVHQVASYREDKEVLFHVQRSRMIRERAENESVVYAGTIGAPRITSYGDIHKRHSLVWRHCQKTIHSFFVKLSEIDPVTRSRTDFDTVLSPHDFMMDLLA